MKKFYKILIAVLLILATVVSYFVVRYQSLIKVVWNGFTLSTQRLESLKNDNEKKTKEIVEKLGIQTVKPLTEEQQDELMKGNLSKEDAIDIVLGKKTLDEKTSDEKNVDSKGEEIKTDGKIPEKNENPTEEKTPPKKEQNKNPSEQDKANERISNLIGEIYVLKAQFTGELKNVEAWVLSEYKKLTPEQKAPDKSPAEQAIGKIMLNRVTALEADCDAKMKAILSELKTLLQKTGQDVSIVSQIRDAYENEKQITKSYYISKYR